MNTLTPLSWNSILIIFIGSFKFMCYTQFMLYDIFFFWSETKINNLSLSYLYENYVLVFHYVH